MNSSYYKYCVVPQCKSTTIKTPNKLFIYVPNNKQIRRKWLEIARRQDAHSLSTNSTIYICEDHFDLPNDMINYTEYYIMGKVSQVRMKPGCIPKKFECQEDRRKRTCRDMERPYILKKQRQSIIAECLNEPEQSSTQSSSVMDTSNISSDHNMTVIMASQTDGLCGALSGSEAPCYDTPPVLVEIKIEQELDDANTENRIEPELDVANTKIKIEPEPDVANTEIKTEDTDGCKTSVMASEADNILKDSHDTPPAFVEIKIEPESDYTEIKTEDKDGCKTSVMTSEADNILKDSIGSKAESHDTPPAFVEIKIEPESDYTEIKTEDKDDPLHSPEVKFFNYHDDKLEIDDHNFVDTSKHNTEDTAEGGRVLRPDGASAQVSGTEKQMQSEANDTNTNQQLKRKQTSEGRHECHVCHYRFTYKSTLKQHLRTHTGEKPFECNVCQVQFNSKGNLNKHSRIHTGERPYECSECHLRFTQKIHLKSHFKTHTGEKPYECNMCQLRFSEKNSLKYHILTHTGEKPHECSVCQMRFTQKIQLKSHFRIHTGEKPYECDVCQIRFTQKIHLQTHYRIHTGVRPYECNVCQVRFNEKGSLKNHLRIHTGERPYQCTVCQSRFNHNSILKKHLKRHTGEKPYECDVCQNRFSRKDSLKIHKKIHAVEITSNVCQELESIKNT